MPIWNDPIVRQEQQVVAYRATSFGKHMVPIPNMPDARPELSMFYYEGHCPTQTIDGSSGIWKIQGRGVG